MKLLSVLLLVALTIACGDGPYNPVNPSSALEQTPVTMPPLPTIEFVGLSFGSLSLAPDGAFTATMKNVGAACVTHISGRTWLVDARGVDSEGVSWRVEGPIVPGQTVTARGCCFTPQAAQSAVTYHVWTDAPRCRD